MTTRQNKRKVVVAMSGGVDSSVAAALSAQAGDEVVGLFMKNWEETDGSCPAAEDYEDVVSVCRQLDIPCYAVNFSEQYWERVFSQFLESLKRGETPNPDVLCNSEIKFDVLKEKAEAIGGTVLVTGHYCRARPCERGKLLLRGLDPNKDQSYFLHAVTAGQLANVEFPIGEYHKPSVRDLAKSFGLATAEKKDSQGICFIGKKNFREFLHQYLPYRPGEFRTLEEKVVGEHRGYAYYTIGQRRGLGIGGAGEAWFVVKKDVNSNVVYVAQGSDHPSLYCSELRAKNLSWVDREPSLPLHCTAQIRYRQPSSDCLVERDGDGVHVIFSAPQKAVTPGQFVVFYQGDECLGGGIISL